MTKDELRAALEATGVVDVPADATKAELEAMHAAHVTRTRVVRHLTRREARGY